MKGQDEALVLSIEGREVRVTHPDKLYFSRQVRLTKDDIVRYYLAGVPFYQKRAPDPRPDWLRTVTLSFPSGRTAEEVVIDDPAGLAWVVNLGCIELHPHAVRTNDLDHPDELRIDLDPIPGVEWDDVRRVATEVKNLLEE